MAKRQRKEVWVLFVIFGIAAVAALFMFQPKLTGNVVIGGQECDGEWTCSDWTACAEGTQTRECSSALTNCSSPITETQSCEVVPVCGDGTVDAEEECDDGNVADNDGCSSLCVVEAPVCGDSLVWGDEICDGDASCNINGYVGIQVCSEDCTALVGECTTTLSCGDTILNGNEECDGTDFGVHTCVEQSFSTGSLTCNSDCTLNKGGCCLENWTCNDWTVCASETQTRTCTDTSSCGTETAKPSLSQSCSCEESWNCTEWSECSGGTKTRTCADDNACGTEYNIPSISHDCAEESSDSGEGSSEGESITQVTITCTPSWTCSEWSACAEGTQARTCTDASACGTEDGKPGLSQSCTMPETCEDGIKNQDEKGVDCGGVCTKRCSIFVLAGSVVSGPVESGKQFFTNLYTNVTSFFVSNKTRAYLILGGVGVLVLGFVAYMIFFRKMLFKSK